MNKIFIIHRHNPRPNSHTIVSVHWTLASASTRAEAEAEAFAEAVNGTVVPIHYGNLMSITTSTLNGGTTARERKSLLVVHGERATAFVVEEHSIDTISGLELLAGAAND